MRADLSVQRTKAKAQSAITWCGTELVCAAVQQENTQQCGYDHAPVTRGRMGAQFLLPHGPTGHKGRVRAPVRGGERVGHGGRAWRCCGGHGNMLPAGEVEVGDVPRSCAHKAT